MLERLDDDLHVAVALADPDLLAGLHDDGRDVDDPAVQLHVAVRHELARGGARGRQAEAVDDVVEAALAELQEDVRGVARAGARDLVEAAELLLEHPVDVLGLLLLAKLHAVVGELAAARLVRRAVLAGGEVAAVEVLVGPEHGLAEATGNLGLGTGVASHG